MTRYAIRGVRNAVNMLVWNVIYVFEHNVYHKESIWFNLATRNETNLDKTIEGSGVV